MNVMLASAFRAEHEELLRVLGGIQVRQFRADEGQQRLARFHDLFARHTAREKNELYPRLRQVAETDEKVAKQLQLMGDDWAIVADLSETFFRKYGTSGLPEIIEFATDHGALLTILRLRFRREEEGLFPSL